MKPEGNELPSEEDSQRRRKDDEEIGWDRKDDITIHEVREAGFKDLSDEQAMEVVEFVKVFCMLCYNIYAKDVEDENLRDKKNKDEPPKRAA